MSLFPHFPDPSFTPLFRLLNDFDTYSREIQANQDDNNHGRGGISRLARALGNRVFSPRFDVRETDTTYELHGELPGIERENVIIEFTEPQTMVVRGRTERSYQRGTPPAGLLSASGSMKAPITSGNNENSRKATVEDERPERSKDAWVAVTDKDKDEDKQSTTTEKYWVSERSVGEFTRTFSFPARVDQDGVTAKLENGILHVMVPKAKKEDTRRISVN